MDQRRAGRERLVERHDRRLGGDLDRDLFGEIFGLAGGIGDHRGDWLADIGDALMGEDRLGNRDIVGAIEERTDRFDVAESSRGYDWHFWRRVHGDDAAARYRAGGALAVIERSAGLRQRDLRPSCGQPPRPIAETKPHGDSG